MNRRLTAVLFATALLGSPALGQESPQPPVGKTGRPVPQQQRPRETGPVISVDFPGGTVGEYVAAVTKAAAPAAVNVVVQPEAKAVQMAPLMLKNVTVETALEGMSYVFDRAGEDQFGVSQIGSGSTEAGEALTFVLRYSKAQRGTTMSMSMPRFSKVHSIRTLVELPDGSPGADGQTVPIDNILNALRIAAEMEHRETVDAHPPEFMLHKDSLLLIARGSQDQHQMVEQVLSELENNVMQRRAEAQKAQVNSSAAEMQMLTIETELRKAEAQVQVARAEGAPAQAQFEEVAKAVEAGRATAVELEKARAQFVVAKTNLESAESYREMVAKRMDLTRRQMTGGGTAAPSAERTVVIYDVRDLKDFKADIYEMCDLVTRKSADRDYKRVQVQPASGDSTGNIVINATPEQHRILIQFFNTARRLKTNEPKLPGLNADDVLKASTKE